MNKLIRTYKLAKEKYIYLDCDGYSASLEDLSLPDLYKSAYSLKQAINYMKRDIAVRLWCSPRDIDIDPSDIVIIERY